MNLQKEKKRIKKAAKCLEFIDLSIKRIEEKKQSLTMYRKLSDISNIFLTDIQRVINEIEIKREILANLKLKYRAIISDLPQYPARTVVIEDESLPK